jgi:NAD(P)-dependent dehydrogenase (short-subunit alcohol dehydrogenase family)
MVDRQTHQASREPRTDSRVTLQADLHGKRALVTGASSGLGAYFARTLSLSGAEVILTSRRGSQLEAVAEQIRLGGGHAQTLELDVGSSASLSEAARLWGRLDILINNAGVTNSKPVFEQTEADWDSILDTNLKGAWLVAMEVARTMKAGGSGGSIINVASILGLRQAGQVTPYAVSKAGIVQLTKQLGLELARFNIRVNALAPGYFATDLNKEFFASAAGTALIKRIPQRRLGSPDDLAGPLLLLASDASRYMTGAVLAVDGGHLLSSL